jgi:exopolysaccharide production protein ExoQ
MGLALDKQTWKWLRVAAFLYIPLAAFMIVMARSGTQTLMLAGATAVFLGQYFLWQPASRIPHARIFIVLLMTVLGLLGAFLIFAIMQVDVYAEILGALGKDSTLTGRTYLWGIAERVMIEHPLTGVGANGFWRPEYGITDSIAKYFDYEKYQGFSFHNSYYENGVMYGYPGFFATMFLSAWAIGSAGLNWFRNQTVVNATFLIFVAMIVIRSNSEADLAGELSGLVVLLLISASRKELGPKQSVTRSGQYASPTREPQRS